MKKFFTLLLVVVLIAVGFSLWQGTRAPHSPTGPISLYSLQGKVVAVASDKLTVLAGGVEQTQNGNQFVMSEKTLNLASSITFVVGTSSAKVSAGNLASRLHVNDQAIFYGTASTSPFAGGVLMVNKIQLTSAAAKPALPKGAPVVR